MLYLLHFEPPLRHARHYLGYTADSRRRLQQHLSGHGSPLVRAALAAGCTVTLVRTWPNGTRTLERKLKNRKHGPRLCPICNPRHA
ncbi:MAG: endonuclease [Caldilineaceae bacterium]|nr:endonuclease [Caldilineaceae bacterium]